MRKPSLSAGEIERRERPPQGLTWPERQDDSGIDILHARLAAHATASTASPQCGLQAIGEVPQAIHRVAGTRSIDASTACFTAFSISSDLPCRPLLRATRQCEAD